MADLKTEKTSFAKDFKQRLFMFSQIYLFLQPHLLTCGVIGNTSDSGSEESRFEPWQVNTIACKSLQAFFGIRLQVSANRVNN